PHRFLTASICFPIPCYPFQSQSHQPLKVVIGRAGKPVPYDGAGRSGSRESFVDADTCKGVHPDCWGYLETASREVSTTADQSCLPMELLATHPGIALPNVDHMDRR